MKKFIGKLVIIILLIFLSYTVFNGSDFSNLTFFEIILFSTVGFYSIISIIRELKYNNYSLNIMHWLFVFFFFFLAPVIQCLFNYNVWGIVQSSEVIEKSCLMIIVWCFFYRIGNIVAYKNNIKRGKLIKNKKILCASNISSFSLILFSFLSIVSTIIIIRNVGFSNLFARSSSVISYDGAYSQMTSLITGHCTKAIILFSAFISIIKYKKDNKGLFFVILNITILILTCFPTAVARNTAGIVYMGLYAVYTSQNERREKNNVRYIILFILAFVVLFPAINAFRNLKFNEVNILETISDVSNNISKNYLTGDYDAFSMIGNVDNYTKEYGFTYGKQFVGGFLFMIPRNIWANKPVGSGSMVFSKLNKEFTNVSCPLISEGYINFGIFGIILLSFIMGFICTKIDYMYWNLLKKDEYQFSYLNLLYPVLLPSYFFMLRGDFMSTWSNLFVYIVFFYVFVKYLYLANKRDNLGGK